MKKTTLYLFVIGIALLASLACRNKAIPPTRHEPISASSPADNPHSVFFKIQEVNRQKVKDDDEVTWLATKESQSEVARFKIRLLLTKASGELPVVFSKGAFLREDGSQSTEFLRQVARVLEAKGEGEGKPKANSLDFTMVILGENLTRGSGSDQFAGGFTSKPPGDWIATKVFVADGEGEFFLNLNPKEGLGEISLKDSEYGDIVLRELQRIF